MNIKQLVHKFLEDKRDIAFSDYLKEIDSTSIGDIPEHALEKDEVEEKQEEN